MSDAIAMLDELRGLFATGELAAARRMCEAVLRELVEEHGGPIAGEAMIMRPIVRDVRELGPLTERAIEAFHEDVPMALARVVQLGSLAAELDGEPRSNERRARLFETPGLEMIELPIEVEHPRTGEPVRQIPRLPADDMPTPYLPPRDAFGAPTTIDDPLQAAYRDLDYHIGRHRWLVELHAPASLVADRLDDIALCVPSLPTLPRDPSIRASSMAGASS